MTIAPLFEVRNHFPFDLQLLVQEAGVTSITTTANYTVVPGSGHTQSLHSCLLADVWYLVQFTVVSSSYSLPVQISTSLWNQLSEHKNECLGLSSYRHCTCHSEHR